ncbi:MAG: BMP family ABC transporter substrate-binding protein [Gemmiger sp.]|uniref:BMP family lipoprotein n=1 Tax=Gemmiger sp. TaxID=2049027 RepID=UPI002E79F535|nr:BMP family ABC transporter substrate-binding protein [Gemmiger sp.]MEE0801422.1 BMP family ABC transporter substrate-binding protein [Gemmiger sp.]
MKKFLALTMAACMALSLAACGNSGSGASSTGSAAASTEAVSDAEGNATAENAGSGAITGIAQCCDVGTLDDESFNQGCWEAVKAFGDENGIEYNYYLPSGEDASDEDRETLVRQAVNEGANTIVCVGYLYGNALAWAATEYPDVHFIGIDITAGDIGLDEIPSNVFCVTFKEEQAGYLAGYAAVKDGFTKLGFLGGQAVPAVIRYGYGFVQGADAAAQEMGVNVQMNYYYGGQFYGDEKITAKMDGWYDGGTEVVFACGGGIWTSAAEAADKHGAKVIGVDVDQNYLGVEGVEEGSFSANPFVTSAMKGLGTAVKNSLATIAAGEWSTIAGTNGNFGLQEGDYVGLPTAEESWNFTTFTVDDYNTVLEKIRTGVITVDNSSDDATKPVTSEYLTVDYQV